LALVRQRVIYQAGLLGRPLALVRQRVIYQAGLLGRP
jgi:hypothetical protein